MKTEHTEAGEQGLLFEGESEARRIVLIDGKNLAYRQHFTHSELSANGEPTGAIYGFLTSLLTLARRLSDAAFVFVWDGEGETWRHHLMTTRTINASAATVSKPLHANLRLPGNSKFKQRVIQGYKAQRPHTDAHDIVEAQLVKLKEFLRMIGLRNFEIRHLEGDDLIGILATHLLEQEWFEEVIVHSTDRDFYQLIPKGVKVLHSVGRDGLLKWVDDAEVRAAWGVDVKHFLSLRALTGDKSDNIPQVFTGIGPKTAAKWVHHGLDPSVKLFDDLPKPMRNSFARRFMERGIKIDIVANWESIHRNYCLCKIVCDAQQACLPPSVRRKLQNLFEESYSKRKRFLHKEKCRSEESWQQMTNFLQRYQMNELLSRRREFWQLL